MSVTASFTRIFDCSLENAFKAPILGDAKRFLSGHGLQPPISYFADDETWGQVGGVRYPVTEGNFLVPKGRTFTDEIIERTENERWRWQIYDFQQPAMFFLQKGVGEWTVRELEPEKVEITYSYTFYPSHPFWHWAVWLLIQLQWKGMMKRALPGIHEQAKEGKWVYPK